MSSHHDLILAHLPLAYAMAKQFPILPYDEAFAEASLVLVVATTYYDPTSRVTFGSFAKTMMIQYLCKLSKSRTETEKAEHLLEPYAGDDDESFEPGWLEDPSDEYAMYEAKHALKHFAQTCSANDRLLLTLKLQRKSQKECMQVLKVSQSTMSRMEQELQAAVRASLYGHPLPSRTRRKAGAYCE